MSGQKGFTLIEIVIVIALFALLLTAFFKLFGGYNTVVNSQRAMMNSSYSSSRVINEMQNYAQQADAVIATKTVNGTAYTTGSQTLILEMPAYNSSGVIAAAFDYAIFYLNGTSLFETTSAAAGSLRNSITKLLDDSVSAFTITYDNADPTKATKVDVDITSLGQAGRQSNSEHLHQQIYFLNK